MTGTDDPADQPVSAAPRQRAFLRIAGWVLLGCLLGAALVAAFLAYGQPELLLEQMNLRYCG